MIRWEQEARRPRRDADRGARGEGRLGLQQDATPAKAGVRSSRSAGSRFVQAALVVSMAMAAVFAALGPWEKRADGWVICGLLWVVFGHALANSLWLRDLTSRGDLRKLSLFLVLRDGVAIALLAAVCLLARSVASRGIGLVALVALLGYAALVTPKHLIFFFVRRKLSRELNAGAGESGEL